jgi:hypothetical protein
LLHTVKEKGGKPDRKPYALPYGLKNPYIQKPQVRELSRLCTETLMKLYVHEFAFCTLGTGYGMVSLQQGNGSLSVEGQMLLVWGWVGEIEQKVTGTNVSFLLFACV